MFIYINNSRFDILDGLTILQACTRIGFEVPRFCYHEKLSIAGNCRMCLIEVSRPRGPVRPKPAASCAIQIIENIFVHVNTVLVKKARESVLEFLLINHPLDCPICDQGGECDLQDQTLIFGSDRGRFYDLKRAVKDKDFGPLIKTSMNRCIHCTRCVRFGTEITGVDFLGTNGRGYFTEISAYVNDFCYSELSANIIDLCPVGALTSKPYAFKARPWELQIYETIDVADSLCSNIRVDLRGLEIMRILPRLNEEINEEWITDRTRFCFDSLLKQRLQKPFLNLGGHFFAVSWKNIFLWLSFKFLNTELLNLLGVVGNTREIETIFIFKEFLNKIGSSFFWLEQNNMLNLDIYYNYSFFRSLKEIEKVDLFILFGFNPRLEIPLLNIRIRKAVKTKNIFVIIYGYFMNLTYKMYNISNLNLDFQLLIEGRSIICRKLLTVYNPLILQGDSFFYRIDAASSFVYMKIFNCISCSINFKFKNKFVYNILLNFSGFINGAEVGFYNKIMSKFIIDKGKNFFVYLLGVNDQRLLSLLSFFKSNIFIIYQGHTGNEHSMISDVILPGSNFIEQKSFFLNIERRIQHTSFIKLPPYLARSDWSIFVALSNFVKIFDNILKYEKYSELLLRLSNVTPIIKNVGNVKQKEFFLIFKNFKGILPFKIIVSPLLSFFFNYYNSDPIFRNSQILMFLSKKYIKNLNYINI